MVFTREDFDTMITLAMQSPELRARLRAVLFDQELAAVPADIQAIKAALSEVIEIVKALAEAQKRTEEQVAKLSEDQRLMREELRALAEAQKRTDEKMAELIEAQNRTDAKIAELTEAQKRTDEKIAELIEAQKRTDEKIAELTEAQKRTDEKIAELIEAQKRTDAKIAELTEAQKRTEEQIAKLIEAQKRTEEQMAKLIEDQRQMREELRAIVRRLDALTESHYKLESRVSRLAGMVLEINYERKAQARFGRILRKAKVVEWNTLEDLLENLSPEEIEYLSETDLVIQGIWKQNPQYQLFLAIEISGKIETWDVKRAVERAKLMHKAGLFTLPAVAGEEITPEARGHAEVQGVIVVLDGSIQFVDEAIRKYSPPQ